jgi:Arc/MetJ family transcription regulator
MTRTNIEIDDQLVTEAMRRFGLKTKREVVDFALRRLLGTPITKDFLLSLEGIGWEGDLDAMRSSELSEHATGTR